MKKLGKYELLGELGRGAFGIVYRARDPVINRMVALKTITAAVADNPNLLDRFYREAQSAGFLQHPNIVTIYDMGDEQGTPYIAMELVDGHNLDDLISRRAAVPLALKLVYAVQACRAFEYAHKHGIIHRDIKPGNVMVSKDGIVKVVDFGIARVLESSKTQTGTLIGTISYIAPELFHGEHATERSDVWSFGVLVYELLAYRQPFSGQSPAALMQSICLHQPLPLRDTVPECPEDLEALVYRMLRKQETERVPSMEAVLLELEPITKRLRAETLSELQQRAARLIEQEEFAQAGDVVHLALQVDANNTEIRLLSEKITAGLKRLAVRGRVEQHVEKGRALMQQRKPREAALEVESALHLDSQFGPACELNEQVQRELERRRRVNEYLAEARRQLVEGMPEQAESVLAKVREIDPDNEQVSAVEQQVLAEKERRHRRTRLSDGLQQARRLWSRRSYQECLDLLAEMEMEFPGEEDVARLVETAREDQAELARQEKLATARDLLVARRYAECVAVLMKLQEEFPGEEVSRLLEAARRGEAEQKKREQMAAARDLFAAQRFAEALAVLDSLLASDPSDSSVLKLRRLAQHEQDIQAKSQALQREWEALKKLVGEKQYEAVIARGEELLHRFPGEPDLTRLVEFARQQHADEEGEQRLVSAKEHVAELMRDNRFAEAEAAARAGLEIFPENADLIAMLTRAETRAKKEKVRQMIEQRIRDIRVKINRGEFSQARELARETMTTFGADTDLRQLLTSAEVECESREKKKRQDQRLDGVRAQVSSRNLKDAAAALDALISSGDFDPLDPRLYEVADEIAAAGEAATATAPLAAPAQAPEPAREYAGLGAPPSGDSSGGTHAISQPATLRQTLLPAAAPEIRLEAPAAASPEEVTPAVIDRAARMLAVHIGPISGVLARQAAQQADSIEALYKLLAENIDAEGDRARFLEDAGFAEL